MAGLTAEGLIIQRLSDVLASQRQKAEELFKSVTPAGEVVDTGPNTTIGRLISVVAPSIADLWEALQQVDSAFDPEKATGIALDKIVKYGALTRLPEQRATAQALFIGDTSVVIPYNSAVKGDVTNATWRLRSGITLAASSASGIVAEITTVTNSYAYTINYTTPDGLKTITFTSDGTATAAEIIAGLRAAVTVSAHPLITATINADGLLYLVKNDPYALSAWTADAKISIVKVAKVGELLAEEAGAITQEIGTIHTITTPVLGWDSVINFTAAVGGSGEETDSELRVRFRNTKYERASNILEALYSALISVEGVTEVVIYENDTNITDVNGVPPHSFLPIINGGDTATLAKTVWENKPLGIRSYQASGTPITIYDSQGFPHLIGINRATPVPIFISMQLTKGATYPADGDTQIKEAIKDYLQGNFGIGDDIVYSRLYTPINSIVGHQVNILTIGTTASPVGTSNILIAFDSIYTISDVNIVITET